MRELKNIGVGLLVLVWLLSPGVGLGALGTELWGDQGVVLGLAPYAAAGILFAAWIIGDTLR